MTGTAASDHRSTRYLDGVRGIAILMVVMVHASLQCPNLPPVLSAFAFYGVRGVQLFFIVSGMTLMLSHVARRLQPANFYARRFFRLAPMFYGGAALYLLLGATTGLGAAPHGAKAGEVLVTLAFVHGWSISAINKIVPGGWSVAAEAMFYAVFPFLLAQARRQPHRLGLIAMTTYFVAGATYYALRRFLPGDPEAVRSFAFDFWVCQLPAFTTGCWLALEPMRRHLSPPSAALAAAGTTLAIIVDTQLMGRSNLLISIALLSLLVWSLGQLRPHWLSAGVLPFLGDVSYSIYILHFAILGMLVPLQAPLAEALGPAPAFMVLYGLTLVIVTPCAWLTYRYVERPAIAFAKPLFKQQQRVVAAS